MGRGQGGRSAGSVYQRSSDGRWVGTLSTGQDETGRRRRRTVYGTSKTDVVRELARLQDPHALGLLVEPTWTTASEFLTWWLERSQRPVLSESTYILQQGLFENHVRPQLGRITLGQIRPHHILGLLGNLERKGVSPRVQQQVYHLLRKAFDHAVRWSRLSENPCAAVDRPRAPGRPMKVWSLDQVRQFLTAIQGERLQALYVLAITTGMRMGELLGLQWEDLDWDLKDLRVVRTVLELKGHVRVKEPKSKAGRRAIALPDLTVAALRAHHETMREEGRRVAWVFCDTQGNPLRRNNLVRRSFLKIVRRAGLPRIRFHDLRHTAATLMLAQGIHPKVVQERLGHASISLTLGTYSHVLPSIQKEAAVKIDRLLGGEGGSPGYTPGHTPPAPKPAPEAESGMRSGDGRHASGYTPPLGCQDRGVKEGTDPGPTPPAGADRRDGEVR